MANFFVFIWLAIFVNLVQLKPLNKIEEIVNDRPWAVRRNLRSILNVVLPNDEGLIPGKRYKRNINFNDPNWKDQTYLKDDKVGHNIDDAWEKGYTGKNITVAVIDDGLRFTHEEFKGRYVAELSYDYVDNDEFPNNSAAGHGTNCAGVIAAAANNGICGVGVAYDVSIAGIRLFQNASRDDGDEAKAFYPYNGHKIDIFSNSWGPPDSGFVVDGPKMQAQQALVNGVTKGRGGRGSIYVFSAGNGAIFGDNCAFNGYVNSIYTIAVGAVVKNGDIAAASETCAAVLTSAYSDNLRTVSHSGDRDCYNEFAQTSAATAMVSGIIALALQANSNLTWRVVQHLVVLSSNPDVVNAQWITNAAGLKVSPRVGFGVLDASRLVKNALKWNTSLPKQIKCEAALGSSQELRDGKTFRIKIQEDDCNDGMISYLEHVQLRVDLVYFKRGVISMEIMSPRGTRSKMIYPRQLDTLTGKKSFTNLTTTSVSYWGEPSQGEWTIYFKNGITAAGNGNGTLFGLSLILYGIGNDTVLPTRTANGITDSFSSVLPTRTTNGITDSFSSVLPTRTAFGSTDRPDVDTNTTNGITDTFSSGNLDLIIGAFIASLVVS